MSGKDYFAIILASMILIGPLAAATIGAQKAAPQTVQKSGANPPGDVRPPAQVDQQSGNK